jgi:hypothetical protein
MNKLSKSYYATSSAGYYYSTIHMIKSKVKLYSKVKKLTLRNKKTTLIAKTFVSMNLW